MDNSSQAFLLDTVLDYSRGILRRFSGNWDKPDSSTTESVEEESKSNHYLPLERATSPKLISSPTAKGINAFISIQSFFLYLLMRDLTKCFFVGSTS